MASDLAAAERNALSAASLTGAPGRRIAPAMRTSFPCTGADLAAARGCEALVFGRYYGNTAAQLAVAYGAYEKHTSFAAVLLPDGRAVGAVRLMHGGAAGLKTLHDAAGDPWRLPASAARSVGIDPDRTWDIASFGVDSLAARGWSQNVTMALFSAMFGAFRDNDVDSFIAIVDRDARRPITALGLPVTDFPGAYLAPYLGSPASVPVYRHVRELHDEHATGHPGVHEQVFHGRAVSNLDPAMAAPGSFALPGSHRAAVSGAGAQ